MDSVPATDGAQPVTRPRTPLNVSANARIQHFEAPTQDRQPFRRRFSEMGTSVQTEAASLLGPVEPTQQYRQRKSLDEMDLRNGGKEGMETLPDTVLEAMRKRGSRGSVSHASTESAENKGKRYAEMIERFQIRRVSRIPSSLSIGGGGPGNMAGSFSTGSVHSMTARDPTEYPTTSVASVHGDPTRGQSYQSHAPQVVPPLGSLSQRLENTLTHLGMESEMITPRDGRERSKYVKTERSSRFSLHWLLVTWKRQFVRDAQYVLENAGEPISPASPFSQVRLIVLMLAATVHVVLFPLETAFFPNRDRLDTGAAVEVVIEIILLVDFALMFNTAFYNKKHQLVTSRREIARAYLRGWFTLDLLSSVPVDLILALCDGHSAQASWMHLLYDVTLRSQRAVHIVRLARFMWTVLLDSPERNLFEWLLYSRYSHLLRIAWIVLFIILIAHYLACGWRLMLLLASAPMRGTPLEEYVASFYDVIQLLQGQGVTTTSVGQNIYGTVVILMGSIVLAIIFGNVAILVANFNANSTSYQRKMESVFAIMSKLQLPAPLRERIHQYYEHLWREYESLDGEIVAFSKGLSHTLELEVVLFKYMDLIMHVPFWRDGSPGFQKQLMLNLHVRVYLPDDFVIRRGEVGDEFFMINRGVCELALGPDSFECTIEPLDEENDSSFSENEAVPNTARYELPTAQPPAPVEPKMNRGRRGSRANVYALGGLASARVSAESSSKYLQKLRRGQSFGEIALLMNYERTANVRALTYVEMCVLHRHDFQEILIKHPKDRKDVLTAMLTKTMENNEATKVWCPLKATVQSVFGEGEDPGKADSISAKHAALLISNAVNLALDDESIKFGIGVRLREQLVDLRDKQKRGTAAAASSPAPVAPTTSVSTMSLAPSPDVQRLAEHVQQLESVQGQMASTMVELMQEVRSLRDTNEQLKKLISGYEKQLAAMARRAEGSSDARVLPPRRLPRQSSRVSLIDVQSPIPEHATPVPKPLLRSRSASTSQLYSARSIGPPSTGRDTAQGQKEETTVSMLQQEKATVSAANRRASFATARSRTSSNLTAGGLAAPAKSSSLASLHSTSDEARPSLNSRLLGPLMSLLTPDPPAVQQSPTMYADQLFQPQRRPNV